MIKWAGDNPNREGLKETPKRVIKAYEEFFSGYKESPEDYLSKTFEDVQGYEDLVMLKDITLTHIVNITWFQLKEKFTSLYTNKKVVGISKLARTVDIFAKRIANTRNNDPTNRRLYL